MEMVRNTVRVSSPHRHVPLQRYPKKGQEGPVARHRGGRTRDNYGMKRVRWDGGYYYVEPAARRRLAAHAHITHGGAAVGRPLARSRPITHFGRRGCTCSDSDPAGTAHAHAHEPTGGGRAYPICVLA